MRIRAAKILGLGLALAATVALAAGIQALAGPSGGGQRASAQAQSQAGKANGGKSAQVAATKTSQPARQFSKPGFKRWVGGRSAVLRSLADSGIDRTIRIAATDGHISLPGRDPLYVFGFVGVPVGASTASLVANYKGNVTVPSPLLGVDQNEGLELRMTNLGFAVRPDLDDSHTVHWHGFRNAISLFDGVPEVSISVPANRTFPYFYRPHDPGTYMYHCHFEDSEHVQMGMDGIVYVRPTQNAGVPALGIPAGKYAYNDGVVPSDARSTKYDREFALLLNEIDTRPHDGSEGVQEFVWSNYKPNFWVINGRSYPDTVKPNKGEPGADPALASQPISSLVQANPNDRVLLRFVNLGYDQHAMALTGIPMRVVGEDATFLKGPGGADLSYWTNTIYIGPGESRDVIFKAPAYDASAPGGVDGRGAYNRYLLKNRNYYTQTNGGAAGLGGMVTEVRVYQTALPTQANPNETYS
jgi:multicopper oxidase